MSLIKTNQTFEPGLKIIGPALDGVTIDGAKNTLSNLIVAMMKNEAVSTAVSDTSTDTSFATAKAVYDLVKTEIDKVRALGVPSGLIDFAGGTTADLPAATVPSEHWLVVGLATADTVGIVGGAGGFEVTNGDVVFAKVANAGGTGAEVIGKFGVTQANVSYATRATAGLVKFADNTTAVYNSTVDDRAATPAHVALMMADKDANAPAKTYSAVMDDTLSVTIDATAHGLGTDGTKLDVSVRDSTTGLRQDSLNVSIHPTTGVVSVSADVKVMGHKVYIYKVV
jgi:hypothetical protein